MAEIKKELNIVITGSKGKIGSGLFLRLKNKYNVIGISRDKYDLTKPNNFIKEILSSADIVFHLAANKKMYGEKSWSENVCMTRNLVNITNKKAKIIFTSSMDVLKNDLTDYAKSKLECEEIVSNHPKYLIIRVGNVDFGTDFRKNVYWLDRLFAKKTLNIVEKPELEKILEDSIFTNNNSIVVCAGTSCSWGQRCGVKPLKLFCLENLLSKIFKLVKRGGIYLYLSIR